MYDGWELFCRVYYAWPGCLVDTSINKTYTRSKMEEIYGDVEVAIGVTETRYTDIQGREIRGREIQRYRDERYRDTETR